MQTEVYSGYCGQKTFSGEDTGQGRFLLAAVNARYIHSNLAVYSLRAYARAKGVETDLAEYTINHQKEEVLRDIYLRHPGAVGFSCYIWNMDFIRELAEELHKIMPQLPIWLGGPEVSWNPEERLEEMPFVTGIMTGEGEQTFAQLAAFYEEVRRRSTDHGLLDDMEDGISADTAAALIQIPGLCCRDRSGRILRTASRELLSMDELVFPYENLDEYANRIIYYESSRGCPFTCSYCLSSVEKKLRFRSLSLVYAEMEFFMREKPAQVKFVDRTFNCRHEHAYGIWKYILEHDNGVTNFHFEIAADLLQEEDFELFSRMRPGLIQLEIGVQTTNPDTIQAIGRKMDLEKVARFTQRVRMGGNIHQHLDLIAGLPQEGLDSFRKSFNDVYAMKPDQLQLGFLKVLHGTRMEKEAADYGLVYRTHPVYEVLYTRWLSFDDILQLKNVEETVEDYYNSGQFTCTLDYVVPFFETPFAFFSSFGNFLRDQGYRSVSQNRVGRYMALRHFLRMMSEQKGYDPELLDELLSCDFCLREKLNRIPEFIPDQEPYRKMISDFFAREIREGDWFGQEASAYSYRQLRGRCQPLVFRHNVMSDMMPGPWLALFDYENRSPMSHNAGVIWIPVEELGYTAEKEKTVSIEKVQVAVHEK
ncbi:MAG: B12-binding domain-containing radical SAM protein [Lachnospiraceae bacterium]|nr:B12-binding domain-containing radical SAM protein [Lachnospiraceae bacterium]